VANIFNELDAVHRRVPGPSAHRGRALPHGLAAKFAHIDEFPEADLELIEHAAT